LHDHDDTVYEQQADAVWHALKRIAPTGWIPSGIDDPIIKAAFEGVTFDD